MILGVGPMSILAAGLTGHVPGDRGSPRGADCLAHADTEPDQRGPHHLRPAPEGDVPMSAAKKRGPGRPQLHSETKLMAFRVPVKVADYITSVIATIKGL